MARGGLAVSAVEDAGVERQGGKKGARKAGRSQAMIIAQTGPSELCRVPWKVLSRRGLMPVPVRFARMLAAPGQGHAQNLGYPWRMRAT